MITPDLSSPGRVDVKEAEHLDSEALAENPTENAVDALARRLAAQYILAEQATGEPVFLYLLQRQETLLTHAN